MSVYTEAEHAIALTDTIAWEEHRPDNPQEFFQYGQYQYRLKDYNAAYNYYFRASENDYILAWFEMGECIRRELIDEEIIGNHAEAEACYKKAWEYLESKSNINDLGTFQKACMLRYGHGTDINTQEAYEIFTGLAKQYECYTSEDFVVNTVYTIKGSVADKDTTPCKSIAGAVLYELAKYQLEGISPCAQDIEGARKLLKRAYDFHYEEALFLDYEIAEKNYESYEYQNDIRQLYGFRIGQYGRITDVHPSIKAYSRLIHMYEEGYPGDNSLRKAEFAEKANRFRKLVAKN
ncbi:MAG: hypothetical protein PHC41_01165 [Lachnospiraceae bacterium]|jgi:TPR repeat protein|nr:hypothetical protein [Lachnospiraceae bacterium]MDD3614816.1 hypothetical protein [Lachnospiraceae bacterium]